jgi:hypothetical protein
MQPHTSTIGCGDWSTIWRCRFVDPKLVRLKKHYKKSVVLGHGSAKGPLQCMHVLLTALRFMMHPNRSPCYGENTPAAINFGKRVLERKNQSQVFPILARSIQQAERILATGCDWIKGRSWIGNGVHIKRCRKFDAASNRAQPSAELYFQEFSVSRFTAHLMCKSNMSVQDHTHLEFPTLPSVNNSRMLSASHSH